MLAGDAAERTGEPIVERIGHREQLDFAAAGVHRLLNRLRAAAAAADQADLDRVAAEGIRPAGNLHLAGGNRPAGHEQRAVAEERAAGSPGGEVRPAHRGGSKNVFGVLCFVFWGKHLPYRAAVGDAIERRGV